MTGGLLLVAKLSTFTGKGIIPLGITYMHLKTDLKMALLSLSLTVAFIFTDCLSTPILFATVM